MLFLYLSIHAAFNTAAVWTSREVACFLRSSPPPHGLVVAATIHVHKCMACVRVRVSAMPTGESCLTLGQVSNDTSL